jgi:hypothetical protein
MYKTILSVILTLTIWTCAVFSTACSPKQLETFKAASSGVVATATGIQTTLNSLIDQGKLTDTQAAFVKVYLSNGIALVSKIDNLVQAVTDWPPKNAAAVIDFIDQAASLIDEAIAQGQLNFKNDQTIQRVSLTLAILKGALGSIKSLLGGKPFTSEMLIDLRRDKEKLDAIGIELNQEWCLH